MNNALAGSNISITHRIFRVVHRYVNRNPIPSPHGPISLARPDAPSERGGGIGLADQVGPALADVFGSLDFEPLPAVEKNKVWRWRQTRRQTMVEFLTPSFSADEGLRDLLALGVSAQSLHFLNYLIAEPLTIPLLYRDGALIQIPRPEHYAIHKLIVSERRKHGETAQKARKDRAQAAFLARVLAQEGPYALGDGGGLQKKGA